MRHRHQAHLSVPWDNKYRQLIKQIGLAIIDKMKKAKTYGYRRSD